MLLNIMKQINRIESNGRDWYKSLKWILRCLSSFKKRMKYKKVLFQKHIAQAY